jgi:hypothetical protein
MSILELSPSTTSPAFLVESEFMTEISELGGFCCCIKVWRTKTFRLNAAGTLSFSRDPPDPLAGKSDQQIVIRDVYGVEMVNKEYMLIKSVDNPTIKLKQGLGSGGSALSELKNAYQQFNL